MGDCSSICAWSGIDTSTNTVTTVAVAVDNPYNVAITPDGRHAYITNYGSDTVSVIKIPTGLFPW